MRRGLKVVMADALSRKPVVASLDPMRRGLKEGISQRSAATGISVASLDPMRRGLKEKDYKRLAEIVREVASLDPMRRGLKDLRKASAQPPTHRCILRPDEKGTERVGGVVPARALWAVASLDPMRRGLKVPQLYDTVPHLEVASLDPMRRGLKEFGPASRTKLDFSCCILRPDEKGTESVQLPALSALVGRLHP